MHRIIFYVAFSIFVFKCDSAEVAPFKTCRSRKVDGAVLKTINARSKIECAAACLKETSCKSSNYVKSNKSCELLSDSYYNNNCESIGSDSSSAVLIKWTPPCYYDKPFINGQCVCGTGFSGTYCQFPPRDCSDSKHDPPEWVDVYPEDGKGKITVWCYTEHLLFFAVPNSGWTPPYLNRTWNDYKNGFGVVNNGGYAVGGYWLGNELVFRITTSSRQYKLKYIASGRDEGWYKNFRVDSEADYYKFHYSSYQNDGSDELPLNGQPFRTWDHTDNGCAAQYGFGFWFEPGCPTKHTISGKSYKSGGLGNFGHLWVEIVRML